MKKPTLILDMDGVMFRWSSQLAPFLKEENLWTQDIQDAIDQHLFLDLDITCGPGTRAKYHQSSWMADLEVWDEHVVETIHALSEHFTLVGLTSFSEDPVAQSQRRKNLDKHFLGMFEEIIMLPSMSPKREQLARWANDPHVYFVDDTLKHVLEALEEWGPGRVCWFRGNEDVPHGAVGLQSWLDVKNWLHDHLGLSFSTETPLTPTRSRLRP